MSKCIAHLTTITIYIALHSNSFIYKTIAIVLYIKLLPVQCNIDLDQWSYTCPTPALRTLYLLRSIIYLPCLKVSSFSRSFTPCCTSAPTAAAPHRTTFKLDKSYSSTNGSFNSRTLTGGGTAAWVT